MSPSSPFSLKDAAATLETTADLLDVLGAEIFRAQAYRSAARSLEALSDWDAAVAAGFKGVPKVGAALAGALSEAALTGRFGPLEEAAALLPPGVFDLLRVRGLGPKKVKLLWEAGLDSLEALREGLQSGRVAAMKGFGAKTVLTLGAAVDFVLEAQTRQRLDIAVKVAEKLLARLATFAPRLSGEVRRGLETTRSVRVSVTATPEQLRAALPDVTLTQPEHRPLLTGDYEGAAIELPFAAPQARGALDLMMGGAGPYRESLRTRAFERGLDLTGHGLKRGGELLNTPEETDVLHLLDLPYRPTEYRESEHDDLWTSLPPPAELVSAEDIVGLIHTHSTWSDGSASLAQMAQAAQALVGERGGYLGSADHSRSAFYAGGLSPERLREQIREVRELQRAGVAIIAGSEVDILEDGSLDFPDDLLAELDYVVASVHSQFTLSEEAQTERLVKAAHHPLITILGHPTGRLLLRRPGYALDMNAVLGACAANQTVVEINASPYRLDLDWRLALIWRDRLKFAVNTDAHSVHGLNETRYGVMMARKAGLRASQVVNSLSQSAFLDFVTAQRRGRGS